MTYSLTIDDVRLSDDGTYSCQEDNRIIKVFVLNIVGRHDYHMFMTSIHYILITFGYIIQFSFSNINGEYHEKNRN